MCMWAFEKVGKRLAIPEGKPLLAYKELTVSSQGKVGSPVTCVEWPDEGLKVATKLLNPVDDYSRKKTKGIYSYKNKPHDMYTWGEIEIWGDVIEHSTGYRSTRAYLTTIHLRWAYSQEVIAGLRQNYPGLWIYNELGKRID